jgi:hypothetical protein
MRASTIILIVLFTSGLSAQNVAILEVLYNQSLGNDKFELVNTSGVSQNVTNWFMCSRFQYAQLGNPADIEVLEGNLNMPAGSHLKLRIKNINLDATSGDFGLYINSLNYENTANMHDFFQYGTSVDNWRGHVAVIKGIWRDMDGIPGPPYTIDMVPTATNGNSTNWDGSNGGGGELTFATDFFNAAPTLPIVLVTLAGRINLYRQVELNWTALDEFNSDKYIIERSIDGQEYTAIGEVSSQNSGPGPAFYSFLDESPVKNSLNYYRIRQLDFDGKEFISSPLYIHMRDIDDHQFFISPNPVSSTACFMLEFYWPETVDLVQFQIVDVSGRLVDDFVDPVMEGYNMVNHQFNGIEPGQYYIVLSDDHGNYAAEDFVIGK